MKKEFKYLSLARKLVFFAALLTILFLFFPWGTKGMQQEESYEFVAQSFSAFGEFAIFGWLLLGTTGVTLFLLGREIFSGRSKFRGVSHTILWILSGGIGVYTIFIALFVLNASYLKEFDSEFSLKIGVFLTLFSQGLLILGGFTGRKDEEKTALKDALSKPEEIDTSRAALKPEPPAEKDQMSLGEYDQ